MTIPKWTIVSAYIGKKKQHRGLTFPTRIEYSSKETAQSYSDKLNDIKVDRWPGHEFEFRVVSYEG